MNITGKFEVSLEPLDTYAAGIEGSNFNRMSINKRFLGELSATSKGEMLSVMTPVIGSAGYVAIEQVSGTLLGKQGTFVLQHYGIMADESDTLILEVVPDSATGELQGLTGKMKIRIENGQHHYDFEFSNL